jgi:hypothetical protein
MLIHTDRYIARVYAGRYGAILASCSSISFNWDRDTDSKRPASERLKKSPGTSDTGKQFLDFG